MIPSHPPRRADWLLKRLASGPKRHSLVGDLHEQYARGRSVAWYWRQTLRTIAASVAWDIRRHPVLALRSAALTYVFLIPWVFFTGYAYAASKWWMEDTVIHGRRVFHDVWVIYQAPLLLGWSFGWALTGWMIASLQPRCRAGMTFVAVCAQLLWSVELSAPLWRLANAGVPFPFYASAPLLVALAIVLIVLPVSLVCGSLCAAPAPTQTSSQP